MSDVRLNTTTRKLALLERASADPMISAGAFRILFAISTFVDAETGQAFPSQPTIAARAGFTLRGLQDAIGPLFASNYLEKIEGGRGRSNRYRLRYEVLDTEVPRPDVAPTTSQRGTSSGRSTTSGRGPTTTSGRGGYHAGTCSIPFTIPFSEPVGDSAPTPSTSKAKAKSFDTNEGDFERFWSVYPRREAKGAAKRAFAKAISRVDLATIIAGAERYADERRHEDPKFTKHPATWLNAECWGDEPKQAHVLSSTASVGGNARPVRQSAVAAWAARAAEAHRAAQTSRDLDDTFEVVLDGETV